MTPLVRLVSTAIFPVAFLISMTHLVEAETGPGDGFTAGIISALGLTLEYVVFGAREMHRRFPWLRAEHGLMLGITIALVAALLPLVTGRPVLAMQAVHLDLPLLGDITLKQTMLFDIGIYFVVLGGAMTAIDHLSEEEA